MNKLVSNLGTAGKASGVLSVGMGVTNVALADDKPNAATQEVGALAELLCGRGWSQNRGLVLVRFLAEEVQFLVQ